MIWSSWRTLQTLCCVLSAFQWPRHHGNMGHVVNCSARAVWMTMKENRATTRVLIVGRRVLSTTLITKVCYHTQMYVLDVSHLSYRQARGEGFDCQVRGS